MSLSAEEFQTLIGWVEVRDQAAVEAWINQREQATHQHLFEQIGRLTRGLYDSINTLQADSGADENPASHRLQFVIDRSQDSANRVLDAVDEAQPIADRLLKRSEELAVQWDRLGKRELSAGDFRKLYGQLGQFLEAVTQDCNDLNSRLQSIVLAQDFQDLTGQVLARVIDMLTQVEHSLLSLISEQSTGETNDTQALEKGLGPSTRASSDAVANQEDVDDLLSSLGF